MKKIICGKAEKKNQENQGNYNEIFPGMCPDKLDVVHVVTGLPDLWSVILVCNA